MPHAKCGTWQCAVLQPERAWWMWTVGAEHNPTHLCCCCCRHKLRPAGASCATGRFETAALHVAAQHPSSSSPARLSSSFPSWTPSGLQQLPLQLQLQLVWVRLVVVLRLDALVAALTAVRVQREAVAAAAAALVVCQVSGRWAQACMPHSCGRCQHTEQASWEALVTATETRLQQRGHKAAQAHQQQQEEAS